MKWRAPFAAVWQWLLRLPIFTLVGLGVLFTAGAVAAAYYGYRTYNYVQHDNDFCLSCHLMQEPYERFAKSAHRDLGCKACHRPTPVARSKMALTQIVQNPEEIETHAEVPNETCMECHVEGDPEKWRLIAASAGHRIHFESAEPSLQGLKCVECHSTSLHEFAAADNTCAQSGCHEQIQIQLGKMSKLSLHCAVCHEFNRPVASSIGGDSLTTTLRPRSQECLSCHAMRALVRDIPADEPHGAVCGSCHNPHEQTTSAQAVQRCSECHTKADTLTPLHRGLAAGALEQCTNCHKAHTFKLENKRCIDCHTNIATGTQAMAAPSDQPSSRFVHRAANRVGVALQAQQQRFDHARHKTVQCESCHDSKQTHGAVTVRTAAACQSCHHGATVGDRCSSCHQPQEYAATQYRRTMTFDMSVGAEKTRAINFDHRRHEQVACTSCHTEPVTRSAAQATCTNCHTEHHQANVPCRSCHVQTDRRIHPPQRVHLGCAGSGCHSELPAAIRSVPRTREFCLSCHQNLVQHQPQKNCVDCHALPRARGSTAWHPAPVPAVGGR